MFSNVKNVELLYKFEELFADLYFEPESPQILGSILQDDVIFKEEEVDPFRIFEKRRSLR